VYGGGEREAGREAVMLSPLAEFPDRGRAVPEPRRPDIRALIVAPYRVMYRRGAKRVVVLTVCHGRRQFDTGEMATSVLTRACCGRPRRCCCAFSVDAAAAEAQRRWADECQCLRLGLKPQV
jgi:hypothetical protein